MDIDTLTHWAAGLTICFICLAFCLGLSTVLAAWAYTAYRDNK